VVDRQSNSAEMGGPIPCLPAVKHVQKLLIAAAPAAQQVEIIMQYFRLSTLVPVVLLLAVGCSDHTLTSEPAQEGPPSYSQAPGRVAVCHILDGGGYSRIMVADAAYASHVAHGDASPGAEVPGNPGHWFDDQCRAVLLPTTSVGSDGGTVLAGEGAVEFVFPENALSDEVSIAVQAVSDPLDSPGMVAGLVFRFLPSGTQFEAPVRITVQYDPDAIGTLDENMLRIQKLVDGNWVPVPGSTVNTADRTVTAWLSSFSVYGVGVTVHRVPTVTVTSLSHVFWKDDDYYGWDPETVIHDAVTFDSYSEMAGNYLSDGFTASVGTGEIIVVRIQPPSGYRFQVTRHRTAPFQTFFSNVFWTTGIGVPGEYYVPAPLSVTYENLDGTAPQGNYEHAGLSTTGQGIVMSYYADVTADFSFTAVEFWFTVSHAVAALPRTYSSVRSHSGPSFGVGARGVGIRDATVMAIVRNR
jgi:hypothetical protein